MSFRTPQVIIRETPGAYVDGVWIAGEDATVDIMASVQPLGTKDAAMVTLPEGRSLKDMVRIYTETELVTVQDKGINQQPDKLLWRGELYELSALFNWQSNVISHFKYFATKIQVGPNDL